MGEEKQGDSKERKRGVTERTEKRRPQNPECDPSLPAIGTDPKTGEKAK